MLTADRKDRHAKSHPHYPNLNASHDYHEDLISQNLTAKGSPVFGRDLAPQLDAKQQGVDPPQDVWQVLAQQESVFFKAVDEAQLRGQENGDVTIFPPLTCGVSRCSFPSVSLLMLATSSKVMVSEGIKNVAIGRTPIFQPQAYHVECW